MLAPACRGARLWRLTQRGRHRLHDEPPGLARGDPGPWGQRSSLLARLLDASGACGSRRFSPTELLPLLAGVACAQCAALLTNSSIKLPWRHSNPCRAQLVAQVGHGRQAHAHVQHPVRSCPHTPHINLSGQLGWGA